MADQKKLSSLAALPEGQLQQHVYGAWMNMPGLS